MLTTVITIVPRFILINQLPFKIRFSQFNAKENLSLNPNERVWYNFKDYKKLTDKKLIIGDFVNDNDTRVFSEPFFLEDIDDFQISYKAKIESNSENPKWYEPTKENNMMRCVRVIITSQDDASIFIYFKNPTMPEYSILNETTKNLIITIKGPNT